MPYKAKTVIAHHQFNCLEGKDLVACPTNLLRQFVKDGLAEFYGDPDEPEEGFAEAFQDLLTDMDRTELKAFMKLNELQKIIPVAKSWTDEQIRQQIREVAGANLDKMKTTDEPVGTGT